MIIVHMYSSAYYANAGLEYVAYCPGAGEKVAEDAAAQCKLAILSQPRGKINIKVSCCIDRKAGLNFPTHIQGFLQRQEEKGKENSWSQVMPMDFGKLVQQVLSR